MATRRDRRRVSAASATLSAGALVFFAASTAPASADTRSAASTSGCPLGKLLCRLLGHGGSTSSPPPASGGGTTTKPTSAPKPKPKPKPRPAAKPPAQAHHGGASGSSGGA